MLIFRNQFDHAIVVVHTHSDDTTSDLFYTSKADVEETAQSDGIKLVGFSFQGMLAKVDSSETGIFCSLWRHGPILAEDEVLHSLPAGMWSSCEGAGSPG